MSEEFTTEQIRQVLDLELPDDYHGHKTVRAYLLALLRDVWRDGEGFNGKRPFGNSSWDYDLKVPMVRAGLIGGKLDSDGYAEEIDDETGDALIAAAIDALDAPRPTVASEPAKVIVVTGYDGKERRFNADRFTVALLGVNVKRGDTTIAHYPSGTYLSVRQEDDDSWADATDPAGAGEASDHDGGSEQPPGNLAARLRAVLLDLRTTPTEARIQALHLLDEDEQRAADLRAHIAGMGGPSPAYVTDDAAGLGSVDIGSPEDGDYDDCEPTL